MPLPVPIIPLCPAQSIGPKNLCVRMPGGLTMCVDLPTGQLPASLTQISQAMMSQVNTALAPLAPFFNIIDAIAAMLECIQGIPDAILQLDPSTLIQCIPNLVEAVQKLLSMIPPLSIPIMVSDILGVVIAFLEAVKGDLTEVSRYFTRVAEAIQSAQDTNNLLLLDMLNSCAVPIAEAFNQQISDNMGPLNQLLQIVNVLLALVPGVDPLPCMGALGPPDAALDVIDTFVEILKTIRSLLPGGLDLAALINAPQGENC